MIIPVEKKGVIYEVIVDDDFVIPSKMYIDSAGYPCYKPTKRSFRRIHQDILPPKEGFIIDHHNVNKLDNRVDNLRYVTRGQNNANKYSKGYTWCKQKKRYRVRVKGKHIGDFKNKEEAHEVFKIEHAKVWGEYSPYFNN